MILPLLAFTDQIENNQAGLGEECYFKKLCCII